MILLLRGPELGRLGAKLLDVVGLYGNTFSTVGEAGVITQVVGLRPASCALSALIFAGPTALHALTMLSVFLGSAAADKAMSDGTVNTDVDPRLKRRPS